MTSYRVENDEGLVVGRYITDYRGTVKWFYVTEILRSPYWPNVQTAESLDDMLAGIADGRFKRVEVHA